MLICVLEKPTQKKTHVKKASFQEMMPGKIDTFQENKNCP